jgi:multiple sugar transport system permease protein
VAGARDKFVSFQLVPWQATLGQYKAVLIDQPAFLVLLGNSVKTTAPVVAGNLVVSMLAAYGFTVWKWRHKEAVFMAYVVVMLMPLQAVLVPNYIVAGFLGIEESYLAIILPGVFAPFGTFLLRQSMRALPKEYFEAARIDGAGDARAFLHVAAPLMKPGMAALAMLTFIEYWNLVEQAVIFIKDYTREPLSVYLSRIKSGNVALVFAASCVFMLPPLLFLLFGQENLEKGIELSGIK